MATQEELDRLYEKRKQMQIARQIEREEQEWNEYVCSFAYQHYKSLK